MAKQKAVSTQRLLAYGLEVFVPRISLAHRVFLVVQSVSALQVVLASSIATKDKVVVFLTTTPLEAVVA